MACSIGDGSEEYETTIICSAWKSRALRKKSGMDLEHYHNANKKACMIQELFCTWLKRFNDDIAAIPAQKIALLVDNYSAYDDGTGTSPDRSNVKCFFFYFPAWLQKLNWWTLEFFLLLNLCNVAPK